MNRTYWDRSIVYVSDWWACVDRRGQLYLYWTDGFELIVCMNIGHYIANGYG